MDAFETALAKAEVLERQDRAASLRPVRYNALLVPAVVLLAVAALVAAFFLCDWLRRRRAGAGGDTRRRIGVGDLELSMDQRPLDLSFRTMGGTRGASDVGSACSSGIAEARTGNVLVT